MLTAPPLPAHEPVEEHAPPAESCVYVELLRELRLFHARIAEAVEASVQTLLCDIAADVLARELQLAPVDIAAIVDRALHRCIAEQPVRVRVHADYTARVACGVPVIADPQLLPGDAVIELRGGTVDASLGVRLENILQRMDL